MKFCKRLVTMLLAAALLLGAIPAVSAVEGYTGVADWFEPSLREMQSWICCPIPTTAWTSPRISPGARCAS